MKRTFTALILACAASSVALADEVVFNNGDRLTGVVKSAGEGKMVLSTKSMGDVTIPLADIKTFSTANPIELHLADGTVLKQPIAQGEAGQIGTAGAGAVSAKGIPLSSITTVNPPAVAPVKWTGSLSAGAILTRGNSDTDSAHIDFNAVRRAVDDRITVDGAYNYGRENTDVDGAEEGGRVTIENWMTAAKYDYFLGKRVYFYGNGKVERDHIANLDLRLTPGVGVGIQWLESERENFNTELGPTWVYERYTDPDVTREYFAARFAYHYDRKINDKVSFIHNLELLPSIEEFGEFLLTTDAGLRVVLTGNFFAEGKVQLQHNSQPAEGKEKDDLRYLMSVGWTF